MLSDEVKEWFCIKAQNDPAFLAAVYLPALEKAAEQYHAQLHEANRKGTLDQIKFSQGLLDGVEAALKIISGIKLASESKRPPEQGSIARMVSAYWTGRNNGD